MSAPAGPGGRPLVVVTGGGGGIGAAVAERLGRDGWYVVTVDPLVSLDGAEPLDDPGETTAGRIVAAGGVAEASPASVTDATALRELFTALVDRHGHLDAVVNVAGISRPTSFARGSEEDWRAVVAVHLDGYLNVLAAALPHMAAAGRGRILGVTSGSGWRRADAGAYGCAKRAVAALTWQLGRLAPSGVSVNAMSPIAVTRMVTAALGRPPPSGGGSGGATGGLSLGGMPEPEELGAFAAHLVGDDIGWSSGRVFFAGGSEVAVIEEPRLLEVVRTDGVADLGPAVERAALGVLAPAEVAQASTGGTNPRLSRDEPDEPVVAPADGATCLVVAGHPDVAAATGRALAARGVAVHTLDATTVDGGFGGPAAAVADRLEHLGSLDAVVVVPAPGPRAAGTTTPWAQVLDEHAGLAGRLVEGAAWVRAVADLADRPGAPTRVATIVDARTGGGQSLAQCAAQLARASRRATRDRVAAFAVAVESTGADDLAAAGALAGHLVVHPEAPALAGAELAVGPGWIGLRSHPRPSGSISLTGKDLPGWFGGALRQIAGATR